MTKAENQKRAEALAAGVRHDLRNSVRIQDGELLLRRSMLINETEDAGAVVRRLPLNDENQALS